MRSSSKLRLKAVIWFLLGLAAVRHALWTAEKADRVRFREAVQDELRKRFGRHP